MGPLRGEFGVLWAIFFLNGPFEGLVRYCGRLRALLAGAVLRALAGAIRQLWAMLLFFFGGGTVVMYSRAPAIVYLRALTVFIVSPN